MITGTNFWTTLHYNRTLNVDYVKLTDEKYDVLFVNEFFKKLPANYLGTRGIKHFGRCCSSKMIDLGVVMHNNDPSFIIFP